MKFAAYGLIVVIPLLALSNCADPIALRGFAQVESRFIDELSGIVQSSQWPGVFWVHNDSGDKARLFALDGNGKSIIPASARQTYYTGARERGKQAWEGFTIQAARNRDWEDITIKDGFLYVADVGNNTNRRQNLTLYRLPEFNPATSFPSPELSPISVSYPDQLSFPGENWHFDSESLFASDGRVYLITKHRVSGAQRSFEAGAKLYRLDSEASGQNNVLTLIGSHLEVTSATGADLSPDEQTLAVLSYTALWFFSRPENGDNWLASDARKIALNPAVFRQVEAVAWIDNDRLILGNEQRDLFHMDVNEAR